MRQPFYSGRVYILGTLSSSFLYDLIMRPQPEMYLKSVGKFQKFMKLFDIT